MEERKHIHKHFGHGIRYGKTNCGEEKDNEGIYYLWNIGCDYTNSFNWAMQGEDAESNECDFKRSAWNCDSLFGEYRIGGQADDIRSRN